MKIKIEYADGTVWEGHPSDIADSPDAGVIRMWGEDDYGRKVLFVYDDFYYVHPVSGGKFMVGSGTAQRQFILEPGRDGAIAQEKFQLPADATVRLGEQVSQEQAVELGLIDEGGKLLSEKSNVIVQVG